MVKAMAQVQNTIGFNMICIDATLIKRQYVERFISGYCYDMSFVFLLENEHQQLKYKDRRRNLHRIKEIHGKRYIIHHGDGDDYGYGDGTGESISDPLY